MLFAITEQMMTLPPGWKWWDAEDGRRIFNAETASGHPSSELVAFQYDATNGPMTFAEVLAAIPLGRAKRLTFTKE